MIIVYICNARQKTTKMSELTELKKKMFKVMESALKLSLNFQGKGTILENKTIEYKFQLFDNLKIGSENYEKLLVTSPDFNLLLSKSRKVLEDLKIDNYSDQVKRYVNDVCFMFESELKSIAKVKNIEIAKEKTKQEIILKQEDITCGCGKTTITDEDIVRFRRIKEFKVIYCAHCNEELITLMTEEEKSKLIIQHKKGENPLDMSSLKNLDIENEFSSLNELTDEF